MKQINIQVFKIVHDLTCKSENLIYLLQCQICKLQYVGKSESTINIHLNDHRKDAKAEESVLACNNSLNQSTIFSNMHILL